MTGKFYPTVMKMLSALRCGCANSQRPSAEPSWRRPAGTYSFSSSCSCSELSSSFRLFTVPWRCSWSADGSTLGWSSLDCSPFSCFCTEMLDGERTREFGLPSSEADCFGLSEELTFWRQRKHLLTLPLLVRLNLWCMGKLHGGAASAGPPLWKDTLPSSQNPKWGSAGQAQRQD